MGRYGKWIASIGLKVYDILAQVTGDDKRKMLERRRGNDWSLFCQKKILMNGAGYCKNIEQMMPFNRGEILKQVCFGAQALNYAR
jgi:glycerol-3-phosphate dehydrogenase